MIASFASFACTFFCRDTPECHFERSLDWDKELPRAGQGHVLVSAAAGGGGGGGGGEETHAGDGSH
jgi:hypothetical protein